MTEFLSDWALSTTSWQAYERAVTRLLPLLGYEHVSLIGQSGDGGADVLATKAGKRWLFQVKRYAQPVGPEVIDRTIAAARTYDADIPVIVSRKGFTQSLIDQRQMLASQGVNVQLWDDVTLRRRFGLVDVEPLAHRESSSFGLRDYQAQACDRIVGDWQRTESTSSLVVLATGLGKTFVAGEVLRRLSILKPSLRVLVLAHTNELVYQLERALWPFLRADQATAIVNGIERPAWMDLGRFDVVVASRDTMANAASNNVDLPEFDLIIVDECHHLESATYDTLLESLGTTLPHGPHLIGLTATPWRPGGSHLAKWFDGPVVSIDLVEGLRSGFLANVNYRMYTDNVNWDGLRALRGDNFSPRAINRTLFIDEWDDAVVKRTSEAWAEIERPRGIVFCGTVSHADRMAERINSLGFTSARTLYSRGADGRAVGPIERNRVLWDFADGKIGILCAVDVLNEGVDVPDVNLIVFQRVTHSRRIFVQQLGRGLRLAPGKASVVVLDFVSDIRRFAAGLELQKSIDGHGPRPGNEVRVRLRNTVEFFRASEPDLSAEVFLREWLGDLEEVEEAGEDTSILRFPPEFPAVGAPR
ncbi:DEAD/DEAH box helicase [Cryobacterium sp. TMT2-18-3]|uniref:DEAD/DEAH box helicase family protein n=1 Tax=Cryobacterium sp. TMT2-18-3 TaxID=1259250 RepID=UPI00106AD79F|nr:DEAD/DEAH box helicase family protein [Cryobacterium sp. TMT2-18-3]TFC26435.1 DEAD/DEAH box helicase [Cryobacterium sp. TMT2-18-2]TFC64387.1 DEAD/DEAH box helicase [Cryobacterium sp. TMT2-18-3]